MYNMNPAAKVAPLSHTKEMIGFAVGIAVFWFFEFLFQYRWASEGDIVGSFVRSFSLGGATLIGIALLLSSLFHWVPRWARYWRWRRYLGVGGVVLITLHAEVVIWKYFGYNVADIFISFNPFANPIIFGVVSYAILFAMAATSSDWAVQMLTPRRWKILHRFVYVAYISAIFHALLMAPERLNNLAGYILVAVTLCALFGQVFWFFKTAAKKRFRSLGTFVGLALIMGTLVLAYIAWGR